MDKVLRLHTGCTYLYNSLGNQLNLTNVLYVPKITKNLVSLSKLLSENHIIIKFISNFCFIKDKMQGTLLTLVIGEDGLFKLLSQDEYFLNSNSVFTSWNGNVVECE